MNYIYSSEYTGYVYIWYDTKSKFFYIGGHYGKVDDAYICSNKPMKRAYNIRPTTFRFKVLEYTIGTTKDLRILEQKWLDKIKDSELMISENVQKGSCRYYNVKKNSAGGNGKGTNKGKSHPAWNKGLTGVSAWNKGLTGTRTSSGRKRKPRIIKKCLSCDTTWEALDTNKKRYCCRSCSPKLGGGWCKGKKLEYTDKLSKAKLGKKRIYQEDGTWIMRSK